MEPASIERIRRTSPRQQNRISFAASPIRPSSSQRKRKRKAKASAEYYSVRDILDEKTVHEGVFYLIDWEDNPDTGESYTPTWEPYDNVRREAITDWEQKRLKRQNGLAFNSRERSSTFESDTEPIRTTKRQRVRRSSVPKAGGTPKKTPLAENPETPEPVKPVDAEDTPRPPSVSQDIQEAPKPEDKPTEIKESYEEDQSLRSGPGKVLVLVPEIDDAFDRDAYAKLPVTSSEPSQISKDSQVPQESQESKSFEVAQNSPAPKNVQEAQESPVSKAFEAPKDTQLFTDFESSRDTQVSVSKDSQVPLESQGSVRPPRLPEFKNPTPRRKPFIWDEPAPIVPDSQELPGSSSSVPSEQDTAPSQNTQWQSSNVPQASNDPAFRHSEPPSVRPKRRLLPDAPEAPSSSPASSTEASSSGRLRPSRPGGSGQSIEQQLTNRSGQFVSKSRQPTLLRIRPRTSHSTTPSEHPSTLTRSASPSFQVREARPAERARGSTRAQSQQYSQSGVDIEQLPFQSQVPLYSAEGYGGQVNGSPFIHHSSNISESHILQHQPVRETNSQIIQQSQLLPTQKSGSSPEESWQAAQITSPPPRPSPESSTPSASIPQEFPIHLSQSQVQISQERVPLPHSSVGGLEQRANHLSRNIVPSVGKAGDIASASRNYRSPLAPRRTPPSEPSMADQNNNSSMSVADMLKHVRATAAANTIARQAEARAASAAPPTQPSSLSQMLPLRKSTEMPSPSSRNSSESESTPKALQLLPLGPEEYVVPLPLNAITRDIYDGEITNFRRQQKDFLKNWTDSDMTREIDAMMDRLKVLCDHQDLLRSDLSTQEMDTFDVQAAWAKNISTKCVFLSSFLQVLRPFNIHIAIVARPGRMLDILEALLRQEGCAYRRPNRPDLVDDTTRSPLRVSLQPSNLHRLNIEIEPASMVIAFDSTFEKEQYPQRLRDDPLRQGSLAPLVHLMVIRSVEHFEMCFDKRMNPIDRRAAMVSAVLYSRHEIGVLPPGYYNPPAAGQDVGRFAGAVMIDRSWPLRPMPDAEGIEFDMDITQEAQPREEQPSTSTSESYIPSAQVLQPVFKRSLSAEDDASSKRQRLTPVIDEPPQVMKPSRISNISSILNPVDSEPTPRTADSAVSLRKSDALDNDEANLVSSLSKKVKDLEIQLQNRDASQAELREQNQKLESRCRDVEKTVQDIQPRYQEALNDRGRFEHEMKESVSREKTLLQRLEVRITELNKLREEKSACDAELSAARIALVSSAIPEVAEFNRMKDEVQMVRGENERLNKRLGNMQNELEYMRTNYQRASSAAGEAVSELKEVKDELSAARRKASANALQIHQYQASSEIRQHISRIEELEAQKAEAERELEKKSEELKALLNGRRTTRGTSVPRSPRMGTMSPGSRPMARVLSVGSRGNSPAPGDGPPYRGTFHGDALFTTAPGSSRWGNHLH